jgi:hypothetical protein
VGTFPPPAGRAPPPERSRPPEQGRARKFVGAERAQVTAGAEARAGFLFALDQLAVGAEHGRGLREVSQQPLCALGQRKLSAGAVDCRDQDRRFVVVGREPGAHAHQRAVEARPEAAQPFEPRRAILRQGAGELCDLRGGRMLCLEAQGGGLGRACAIEYRGGNGIGPQHAAAVGTP